MAAVVRVWVKVATEVALLPMTPDRIAPPVRPPAASKVQGWVPDIVKRESDEALPKASLSAVGTPPQTPPAQKFPAPQAVQSGSGAPSQRPLAGLQVAAEQPSPAGQTTSRPPQTPAVQTSPVEQRLPSLQRVPSTRGESSQRPLEGLQDEALQASPPVQITPAHRATQLLGVPLQR